MLRLIQIIAVIQGLFVLFVLFNNRREYKRATFWLLFGCLFSIILYIIGDDKNNLFVKNIDWFLFDNTLFVTFLFLFFGITKVEKKNLLNWIFFFIYLMFVM